MIHCQVCFTNWGNSSQMETWQQQQEAFIFAGIYSQRNWPDIFVSSAVNPDIFLKPCQRIRNFSSSSKDENSGNLKPIPKKVTSQVGLFDMLQPMFYLIKSFLIKIMVLRFILFSSLENRGGRHYQRHFISQTFALISLITTAWLQRMKSGKKLLVRWNNPWDNTSRNEMHVAHTTQNSHWLKSMWL